MIRQVYAKHEHDGPVCFITTFLVKIMQSNQVASGDRGNLVKPRRKNIWNEIIIIKHIVQLEGKSTFNLSRGYIWCMCVSVCAYDEFECVYQNVTRWMHMWTQTPNIHFEYSFTYFTLLYWAVLFLIHCSDSIVLLIFLHFVVSLGCLVIIWERFSFNI